MHFFDQNAWLKLQKDDENLKVVKKLQQEINDLRLNNGSALHGAYADSNRPNLTMFRSKANYDYLNRQYRSTRDTNFHETIIEKKRAMNAMKNVMY